MRHFGPEEQARAVGEAQAAVWRSIVSRFEHLKTTQGFRQADLAAALGVSRPQIHEWLSDSRNMTLKAAGRLLLAMDAQVLVEVRADAEAKLGGLDTGAPNKSNSTPNRSRALAVVVALVSILATASLDQAHAVPPALRLTSLGEGGTAPVLAGRPTILVFWRADCAPCLIELVHLRQLEAASGRARLALVALDDAPTARAKLRSMGLTPRYAWRLQDDPAATLSALGQGAPRLPLSAAYDAAGRPCGLHIGLLGVDQVRSWARACF